MQARLVRIGNSRGVRIPRAMIETAGLGDVVDLVVEDGVVLIRRTESPRAGWDEAFAEMAARADDVLLDGDDLTASEWDRQEWECLRQ